MQPVHPLQMHLLSLQNCAGADLPFCPVGSFRITGHAAIKNQDLSAAEVILCNENHISHLKDSTALMEALYNDEETAYHTLVTSASTSSSRIPVLSAIANLYLKQQIILQQI